MILISECRARLQSLSPTVLSDIIYFDSNYRLHLPRELVVVLRTVNKTIKMITKDTDEHMQLRRLNQRAIKVPWDQLYKGSDADNEMKKSL